MPSPQSTQNDDQQSALEQFGINLTAVSYTHLTLPTTPYV